ncbi:hypothetical protein VNO80_28817 [Phaseolus coccineus]|uniref:Uncharacterized protein n=1 Tax=Phaseolus coccineus TaxID=3886 RepID=A0AAN9L9S7_PHACN
MVQKLSSDSNSPGLKQHSRKVKMWSAKGRRKEQRYQLEKELDRIDTGNMKHHVNLTRYRRSETNPSQDDREKAKSVVSEHRYNRSGEKKVGLSYVEAVRGASSSKSQDT